MSQSTGAYGNGGHYAVSSHVSNGNLVVDNGQGVIQQGSHGVYEENLSKFKGAIFILCQNSKFDSSVLTAVAL